MLVNNNNNINSNTIGNNNNIQNSSQLQQNIMNAQQQTRQGKKLKGA